MNQGKAEQRQPVLIGIEEAAKALAVGRFTIYNLIEQGELPTVRMGRAARVPAEAIADIARTKAENALRADRQRS